MSRPAHTCGTTYLMTSYHKTNDHEQHHPLYGKTIIAIFPVMEHIIGKTKSTNFQNEKYKKGMSFKYYINGA